jgi:telomerase reverse transcriptase
VLRNLKNILGNKFGYSVFDNRQIMKKYDTFVDKWRKMGSPPMKYFTLDIHKCYDSINTSLLLKFIEETPYIDDQYVIVKYNRLYRNKRPLFGHNSFTGYFNYRERMSANSMSDDMMQIKEELKVPSIHVFPAKQRLITKKDIINKLSKICEGSIVGYRKHYWLQKLGIPQGLNVSGVLCSLYFACLEDNFVKVKDGLLMRLTDDYLYIGP